VTDPSCSAAVVQEIVAVADRRRRMQAAGRVLSRAVPGAGALVLGLGLIGSALGWPTLATLAACVVLTAVLAAWAVVYTRRRATTDRLASLVDTAAGLGGELRSACWFAGRGPHDDWTTLHLDRAAEHARAVAWRGVYPPVQARAAWLVAAVLTASAFALPAGVPTGAWTSASTSGDADLVAGTAELVELPEALRDRLMALLAAVHEGRMTTAEALAALRALNDFVKADPAMQQDIEDLLADAASARDRFERTGAPGLSDSGEMTGDVEWARQNLASRLASEEAQRRDEADADPAEAAESLESGPMTEEGAQGEAGEASDARTGARVPAKPADAGDGAAGMMLATSTSTVGEPGSVFGGKRGNVRYGTSAADEIAAALKREFVEASVNVDHSDLDREDRRRKTRQSWSALRLTSAAGRASFDRARTEGVRAVPEARRPLVERYFVRPAEDDPPPAPSTPAPPPRD
jgi:hypothetical protein